MTRPTFSSTARLVDPTAALILWQVSVVGEMTSAGFTECRTRTGSGFWPSTSASFYPHDHEVTLYECSAYPVSDPVIRTTPLGQLAEADLTPARDALRAACEPAATEPRDAGAVRDRAGARGLGTATVQAQGRRVPLALPQTLCLVEARPGLVGASAGCLRLAERGERRRMKVEGVRRLHELDCLVGTALCLLGATRTCARASPVASATRPARRRRRATKLPRSRPRSARPRGPAPARGQPRRAAHSTDERTLVSPTACRSSKPRSELALGRRERPRPAARPSLNRLVRLQPTASGRAPRASRGPVRKARAHFRSARAWPRAVRRLAALTASRLWSAAQRRHELLDSLDRLGQRPVDHRQPPVPGS